MTRLEALFSADKVVRDQYAALTGRIAQENSALQTLETRLTDAQGAAVRRKDLQTERDDTYGRVFEAIINEQSALASLYAPLMARLAASSGTLKKLSFAVRRIADVQAWGSVAEEELLDRRKTGSFYGRGSLIAAATEALKPAWETGSAVEVQAAMTAFMAKYLRDLLSHAPFAPTQQAEFRAWSKRFAHWLFGTDHITVQYEISYDGVDIRKLSPGTRGIVLLLLYLALDDSDDRPLIIDQPEENLDPKSVFDELVALFVAAKAKRQVIMVTHNANLVINTDADQIIVASAGPHPSGGLPCQSASKIAPQSASKIDPLGMAVSSAAREAAGSCADGQSRPNPRGGSMAFSSSRSKSQMLCSASAVGLSCKLAGKASSHAAYWACNAASSATASCQRRARRRWSAGRRVRITGVPIVRAAR